MAVYHHILVIPPTVKVVTAEKRKTACRQNNTAVLHYRRKILPCFGFTASAKTIPPTLDTAKKYRQLSTPPKEYRQLSIPPKRYRQHWISPKRYRRHWIPPQRYRRYWVPPKRYRLHNHQLLASCGRVALVGEAGRTRNSLAHWEKKREGGFRRGWGYPRRFIVNMSRHSIIIVVSGYCFFPFLCVLHEAAHFHS